MARINNLTDFLTDVSSAIKQKTGDSAPIPASEFDTEILSIETAGNYQEKTLNITQNGNYNLLPDQEFDAISNVNISVNVDTTPVLQNKTITENGSYTADQNYDGLGTVIVNVPTSEDLQEQLDAQDAIIEELQTELENKARSKYNAKIDMSVTTANPELVRFITEISDDSIDIGELTDISHMFAYWENLQSIPLFDTSNVINMKETFRSCHSIRTIPLFNTSNVTNMNGMLRNCERLEEIPLLDTSNVKNMDSMFNNCLSLKTVPLLNTSKVQNMANMFNHCEIIEEIPVLDTTSVNIANNMFGGCHSLKSIPNIYTSHITAANGMFWDCTSITSIPEFDFRRVSGAANMFNNCNKLVNFPVSRMDMLLYHQDMFLNCTSLSDESLNNILSILSNATRITSNKTLSYAGLSEEQATRCAALSNYQAFLDAGWTTGY